MCFVFLSVFAAMVIVTDAMKESTETLLRREIPAPHDVREKIEREARWAERIERHEGTESAHEHTSNKTGTNPQVDPIYDTDQKDCLKTLVAKASAGDKFALSNVCKEDETNEVKDDHGNYIRWTMREDRVAVKIWENTIKDCEMGQPYLRDIIEGFGSGISCFKDGTGADVESTETEGGQPGEHMVNNIAWKTSGKKLKLHSGNEVEHDTHVATYKICEGAKGMTRTKLTAWQEKLKDLVKKYDDAWKATPQDKSALTATCQKMYMAHGDQDGFNVRDVLTTSRSFICKAAPDGNPVQCEQMEAWYMDFMNRNLFAIGARDDTAKKGRSPKVKGAGGRSEACIGQNGPKGAGLGKTDNHGITTEVPFLKDSDGKDTEVPACLVEKPLRGKILNANSYNSFKGGLYTSHMSGNILAKHFAFCDVPFVAGVSGSVPQYMMMAGGSPAKNVKAPGYTFANALNDKELMALMGMLELAGFHSITELIMAVNFYRRQLLVVPPFDSGCFDSPDATIRCHDTGSGDKPGCCATEGLKFNKFNDQHNGEKYKSMMKQFEAAVDKWQEHGSFSPQVVDKAVDKDSPAAAGTAPGNADAGPGEGAGGEQK